jgi:ribonuclease Z
MAFQVTILGNSSASPSLNRHPSGQYLNILDHHILVDCGEGTQMQLQRFKIKKSRINQIFISHVHGDHILGLPGLLLSMNLMGREAPIHIYGPKELFEILNVFFKYSDTRFNFELNYHTVDPNSTEVIFENIYYKVIAFPLYHRVPTAGFLFQERSKLRKLNTEACEKHKIPFTHFNDIKRGKDYYSPDGKTHIKNHLLSFESGKPITYAYCSDTIFHEEVIKVVENADILYHEATFMHDKLQRAIETMHTTCKQAGIIAKRANVTKLIIGHFSARYDNLQPLLLEAKAEFENTEIADEGRTFIME